LFRAGIALLCLAQGWFLTFYCVIGNTKSYWKPKSDSLVTVNGFMELTNYLLNIMATKFPTDAVIRKAHSLQLSIPYLSTSPLRKSDE